MGQGGIYMNRMAWQLTRIARSTWIGTVVAVAAWGNNAFADQQEVRASDKASSQVAANDTGGSDTALDEVVVTGIRYSLKESLATKRASTDVVEVVTAEDIGKLPDKNIADVLQRVPGVNTQSAASGEGGFDENNRVSIRGTSASLTQTTINGHSVSTGDWFINDQYQTVGRSASYDLLPSEIVARTVVTKTQSADLIEGGVAGSIDIQTPKPLDFKETFTASGLAGGVYSDLPSKTEPQFNALFNWQNGTMGLLAMGFYEARDSRRDGQEVLGYGSVPAATAAAWQAANPALPNAAGAQYPTLIGSALFTQKREREGGLIDFEVKPTDNLTLDLNGFYSRLLANNVNDNFLMFGSNFIGGANSGQYVPTALTVRNGTLVGGTWPTIAGAPIAQGTIPYNTAVYDQIVRPSDSGTYYIDFDATLQATDKLTFTAQLGYTRGVGNTPQETDIESQGGNGVTYQLNGISNPVSVHYPGLNPASPAQFYTDYAFGSITHEIDEETYGQIDGLLKLDSGVFQSLKFGARFAEHERDQQYPENNGCPDCGVTGPNPAYSGGAYPSNFGSALGGSGYPTNIYTNSNAEIQAFDALYLSHGPSRFYWPGTFEVKEGDAALYAMANVGGDGWSGNFGVRAAHTANTNYVNVGGGADPITTSLFGPYTPTAYKNNYLDFLPSANLKFDLTNNLVLHFSAAQTMARPDYSALGAAISLTDLNNTGSGGNPTLRPIRSTNYDTTLEWYYAPQSLLQFSLFDMEMSSYVDYGTSQQTFFNLQKNNFALFNITLPVNTTAQVRGAELAWTQPLWLGFGAQANFTYANGQTGLDTPMVGQSAITYNLGAYYEAHGFSAHLDYTYRSHYLVGLDHSSLENEAGIGNLGAALNYSISKNLSLSLNLLNLANETLKYYGADTSQPRAFYSNGRQYYFGVNFKL
jgi:iron complex outermembrane recepter protein